MTSHLPRRLRRMWLLVVLAVLAWLIAAVTVAVLIARAIRLADQRAHTRPEDYPCP